MDGKTSQSIRMLEVISISGIWLEIETITVCIRVRSLRSKKKRAGPYFILCNIFSNTKIETTVMRVSFEDHTDGVAKKAKQSELFRPNVAQ